ncbi:MAG: ankyrin repeat domain-containing protein [Fimbriimonadaceae bacterium]
MSGDIAALGELALTEEGFPAGEDPWLHRHWLTNAIDCGSAKVVRWMLQKGASPVFADGEGYTSLHSAIEREEADKYEIMTMLIEFGADLNAHGVNDWTPAHLAAARDDVEALRILNAANADFSIRTRIDSHLTPLEEARLLGHSPEAVAYLKGLANQARE